MAAFTSLRTTSLHLGQVHSLSDRVSSLLIYPQFACSFDDGSNLPIFRMFLPYQSALYSNIVIKLDQPASLIDCARLWFASIPLTFKSSIAKLSWFLISSLEVLCKKSFLWLATFSCKIANLCLVLLPLCFEYLRCTNFSLLCALRRNFGLSYSFSSDETRYVLIPKSIPIVVSSLIFAFGLIASPVSQSIETKYLPVGVLLIVACLISPLIGLCKTILIPFLNLGIINFSPSKVTFCGILKEPPFDFFLNFGKLLCPLKKRVKALSKFLIGCCKDWLLISLSHVHSSFKSGSCLIRSKQLRLTRLPAHAADFVSKARLYTNLTLPICLLISSAWVAVGEILYRKAFNTMQIYNFLQKRQFIFKFVSVTECRLHHTIASEGCVLRSIFIKCIIYKISYYICVMEAKKLRQPYLTALQKIAKHVGDNNKKVEAISKDTKVCVPSIQMALLGRIVKFDTAEKIIQWGIDHKVIKE